MNILAIDPGKTTGLCFGRLDNLLRLSVVEGEYSVGAMYNLLRDFVDARPDSTHVIYEDFEYRNYARMGLDLTPVKIIGIIELFREWHEPFVSFYKQSAATGKAFYSDAKLKELGVYEAGKRHGRDATRHLLQWANFGAGGQFMDVTKIPMELVQ